MGFNQNGKSSSSTPLSTNSSSTTAQSSKTSFLLTPKNHKILTNKRKSNIWVNSMKQQSIELSNEMAELKKHMSFNLPPITVKHRIEHHHHRNHYHHHNHIKLRERIHTQHSQFMEIRKLYDSASSYKLSQPLRSSSLPMSSSYSSSLIHFNH